MSLENCGLAANVTWPEPISSTKVPLKLNVPAARTTANCTDPAACPAGLMSARAIFMVFPCCPCEVRKSAWMSTKFLQVSCTVQVPRIGEDCMSKKAKTGSRTKRAAKARGFMEALLTGDEFSQWTGRMGKG